MSSDQSVAHCRGLEGVPVTQGVECGPKGKPCFLDFDLVGL